MSARQLKVFQAHLGFYDTVVAAPSQKAALAAWGARSNEFAKGFARVTNEPEAVANALAHPGEVLKRPFGSKGAYKLQADPFPAPKVSRRRASAVASTQRKRLDLAARKAAELELRRAREEAKSALKELKSRERELVQEKKAEGDSAKQRIARAKARLAQLH
jgi:uncharacterized protein with WD repeat